MSVNATFKLRCSISVELYKFSSAAKLFCQINMATKMIINQNQMFYKCWLFKYKTLPECQNYLKKKK